MAGMKGLVDDVLSRHRCVSCGGCVGLCPHVIFCDGRTLWTDECNRDQGRCYEVCPSVARSASEVSSKPIGRHMAIYRSRACDGAVRGRGQYGATISALVLLALQQSLIEKAVLTSSDHNGAPRGRVVERSDEVLDCSGSRYVAAGTLEAFNHAVKHKAAACGIVALPCQAKALRNIETSTLSHSHHKDSIALVLGLFCTWALDYRLLQKFLKGNRLDGVAKRYDIPPPPANVFQVITESETVEFPLDVIRPMVMEGCSYCSDMTAEGADLSVGAVEGMDGWNTLIIRTPKGDELVRLAQDKGVLELETMPEEHLAHLKEASLIKRRRGHAKEEEDRRR